MTVHADLVKNWKLVDREDEYREAISTFLSGVYAPNLDISVFRMSQEASSYCTPEKLILYLEHRFGPPQQFVESATSRFALGRVFLAYEDDISFPAPDLPAPKPRNSWFYLLKCPQYLLLVRGTETAITLHALRIVVTEPFWEGLLQGVAWQAALAASELEKLKSRMTRWRIIRNPSVAYEDALYDLFKKLNLEIPFVQSFLRNRPGPEDVANPGMLDAAVRLIDMRHLVLQFQLLSYVWPDVFATFALYALASDDERRTQSPILIARLKDDTQAKLIALLRDHIGGGSEQTNELFKEIKPRFTQRNSFVHGGIQDLGIWNVGSVLRMPPFRVVQDSGMDSHFTWWSLLPTLNEVTKLQSEHELVRNFIQSTVEDIRCKCGAAAHAVLNSDAILLNEMTGEIGIALTPGDNFPGFGFPRGKSN